MCFDSVVFKGQRNEIDSLTSLNLTGFVRHNEAKAALKYLCFGFLPSVHSEVTRQKNSSRSAAGGDLVSH